MTTGCNGGWLTDPRAYFFADVIRRIEGEPAPDWKQVLESLPGQGMGVNPKPGQIQPQDAPFYGITVMIDSGGNARGRIWLPTNTPVMHDGNAWYTREIQVIADGPTPGTMVWAWIDKGGAQYAPHVCDSSTPPPEPQPQPPAVDLEPRVAKLEEDVKHLTAIVQQHKEVLDTLTLAVSRVNDQILALSLVVSNAAQKGGAVEVRVGRNYGHGHAATGVIL
jgi:hypothetical protein